MAEAIGVFASGVAVVRLTAGIATAALKLKRLWDEVKDVPENIQSLLEQIDILRLAAEDTQHGLDQFAPVCSAETIVRYCQKAEHSISELVDTMSSHINSSKSFKRGFGKIRFWMRKDLLQAHERNLRNAFELLMLVNQQHMK
ncbi:Uu.00g112480.m01.CDS01 [Anthostomella pinea]|uniref:Uu.00g112480.m01.CDS01 n=1 Tax=Anthostomella pinea TaxID=933095 RepID=A0AAI8YGG0_9PEZI|nr:Uu.00g112480.m01.CDS01 [Anthostomella pinea]